DVFIILGDNLGFNNGDFLPPTCSSGLTPAPIEPEPGINIVTEGGVQLGETTPMTLLKDVSGIYTLVPNKRNDTLYDRQESQTEIDVKIPNPGFKTGYIGG